MPEHKYRFRAEMPRPGLRASTLDAVTAGGDVAVLRLYDPIDSWGGDWGVSSAEFSAALDAIPESVSTIRLHINSPGGDVFEAIAMLNSLRHHPARVEAYVDGLAASAASFLAASADETIMGEGSQMMIHDAWGMSIGNADQMRGMGDVLDQISDNIAGIYAAASGVPAEDWRALMRAETWYLAEEAVAAGLANRLAGERDEAKVAAAVDLSAFRHASRNQAPPPPPAAGAAARARQAHRLAVARRAHLSALSGAESANPQKGEE